MTSLVYTPVFDRAAIMRDAWRMVRKADVSRFPLRLLLRNALRTAWTKAKTDAFYTFDRLRRVTSSEIAAMIIESKDAPLTSAEVAELRRLRREVA